jgi:transposase-like protein
VTISSKTKNAAVSEYLGGTPGTVIAARLGVNRTTVYRWIRAAGHEVNADWSRIGKRPDDLGEIIAAYEGGESLASIGARHGASHTAVAQWLRSAGVEIRGVGRPRKEEGEQ